MSTSYAVRVNQLAKSYIIAHEHRPTTLGEAISNRVRQPLKKRTKEEFWALRDVSFDIAQGEVVGIIGRNGAGKSTLLKILSRIVSPTKGHIEMYGRVGSLLEVGTGFHAELTGRENIFLNGSILGMRHREIERHFDEIVDFAGVEQFLDTPVKRYSSGMYVRLAFAVAAHLRSNILIIDEVLAVGDAEFQKKCLGKMKSIANNEGRTILFVSHNMASVHTLCQRCVLLNKGHVAFDGACEEATKYYLAQLRNEFNPQAANSHLTTIQGEYDFTVHDNPYREEMYIQKVFLRNSQGQLTNEIRMGESLSIEVVVQNTASFIDLDVLIIFKTRDGITLSHVSNSMTPSPAPPRRAPQEHFYFTIPSLPYLPGNYEIDILLRDMHQRSGKLTKIDRTAKLIWLKVTPADVLKSGYEFSSREGHVYLDASWKHSSQGH